MSSRAIRGYTVGPHPLLAPKCGGSLSKAAKMQLPSSAGLMGGGGALGDIPGWWGVRGALCSWDGVRKMWERGGGFGVLSSCCRAVSNLIEMTGI